LTPELSRRIGSAVGTHSVTPAEQSTIVRGAADAETWEDLPAQVRQLVADVESRPESPSTARKGP
jgi:hypothetical protein